MERTDPLLNTRTETKRTLRSKASLLKCAPEKITHK